MTRTDYKIAKTTCHDHRNTTWRLEIPGHSTPYACEVFLERAERSAGTFGARVRVKFEAPSIPYARAEAARMYAMLCDTVGDLAMVGEEPLQIEEPVLDLTPRCPTVTVTGWDALVAVAGFFGDALLEVI